MTPQNAQRLFGEFSRLLIDLDETDLYELPNGWFFLIQRMCQEIEEEIVKQGGNFRTGRWLKLLTLGVTKNGMLDVCFDDSEDLSIWDLNALNAPIVKATRKGKHLCKSCGRSNSVLSANRAEKCPSCTEREILLKW